MRQSTPKRKLVPSDPYDPRFPHGSSNRRTRACSCDACYRSRKKLSLGHLHPSARVNVPAGPARDRILECLAAGASVVFLERHLDVGHGRIRKLVTGDVHTVREDYAASILALHPEKVALLDPQRVVSPAKAVALLLSLRHNRWTREDMIDLFDGTQCGVAVIASPDKPISQQREWEIVARWRVARDRYGSGRPHMARKATEAGIRPPDAFDDSGDPVEAWAPRPIRGGRDVERDAVAYLTIMRAVLIHGVPAKTASAHQHVTRDMPLRLLRQAGVKLTMEGVGFPQPDPRCGPALTEVRGLLAGWSGGTHDATATLDAIRDTPARLARAASNKTGQRTA